MKQPVKLDKERIFPTDHPRVSSSYDLAKAKSVDDIDFEGVVLDNIGDGNLYVKHGHHRVGRAMELAPGATVELEVNEVTTQDKLDIYGARLQFERNKELRNYAEYIERTKWLRRDV